MLSSKIINKKVGDAEPTLDEYKALISNFPNDGSVTLEVLDHPDNVGERIHFGKGKSNLA